MPSARLALPLLAALVATPVVGCEDEPLPPPNKPSVVSADALCRRVEGVFKLDQITVEVLDLDGIADLNPPEVTVISTELTMMVEPAGTAPTDDEGEPLACAAEDGQCVARYTWRHSPESEQIFCGRVDDDGEEHGDLLEIIFEIDDIAGFWVRRAIPTREL